jgi:DNA-binding MarR family transcriptional regulator
MTTSLNNGRKIGALLRIPFQATVECVRKKLEESGYTDLTMAHFTVFQHLPPGGARVSELAAQAQITKQSMGALVLHLERCGYLERHRDPTDRRASIVQLTARGEALVRVARSALQELEDDWDEHLGGDRMTQLRSTLRDLIALIESEQSQSAD